MNYPIEVSNEGEIHVENYNFMSLDEFKKVANPTEVTRLVFRHNSNFDKTTDVNNLFIRDDWNKVNQYHYNMIEVIKLFVNVTELFIQNYPYLSDKSFESISVSRLEMFTHICLLECPSLGSSFFRWVSNNCKVLKIFDLTCAFNDSPNRLNVRDNQYYGLDSKDVSRLLINNANTLEGLHMSLTHVCLAERNEETFEDLICKCVLLERLSLHIKYLSRTNLLKALLLPRLVLFKYELARASLIDFNDSFREEGALRRVEGKLEIRNDRVGSHFGRQFSNELHSILSFPGRTISRLVLSGLDELSDGVIETMESMPDLTSVSLLNCGTAFGVEAVGSLMTTSKTLKFLSVVEGSAAFGPSNVVAAVGNGSREVVFVVKKNRVMLDGRQVKLLCKFLSEDDKEWLWDNSNGKGSLSDDDEEDKSDDEEDN
jgi:hypothetical protein